MSQCEEVILFEKSTLLVITSYDTTSHAKKLRKYEDIFVALKSFRRSCNNVGSDINSLSIQGPGFQALVADFTSNTLVLFVSRNKDLGGAALSLNVDCARNFFLHNAKMVENILIK